MNQLKIKDNSQINKEHFFEVQNLVRMVADKNLEQLEKEGVFIFPEIIKDAEDLTKDQMILKSYNESYCSSNVMGFIGFGNERLIIESRFSTDNDFFFQYLLEQVLEFPNILDLKTDSDQDNRMFNLLVFMFPYYLKIAMRKGIFKTYNLYKYNDQNIKGTIDVVRHINKNTPFIGNFAYKQREFSFDNYLMELIRHTIEFLKKKPYGNNLLRKVKDEVAAVIVNTNKYELNDRRKVIIENKKHAINHAYYHEYRVLQRLCIMILQYEENHIGSGIQQIHGILFDGAWLWEEYINQLVSNIFYHPMNKGGKGAQRLFDGNVGLIYPDFISRDSINRVIADAKYKPIGTIGNKDYLQVLAYMYRFDAKQGYYFYPETEKTGQLNLMLNKGSTYEKNVNARIDICMTKLGLHIPTSASSYADFSAKMKLSEQEFFSMLQ